MVPGNSIQLDDSYTLIVTTITDVRAGLTPPAYFIVIADKDDSVYIVGSAQSPDGGVTEFTFIQMNNDGTVEQYTFKIDRPTDSTEWIDAWADVTANEVASVSLGAEGSALKVALEKVTVDDDGSVSYEKAFSGERYDIASLICA